MLIARVRNRCVRYEAITLSKEQFSAGSDNLCAPLRNYSSHTQFKQQVASEHIKIFTFDEKSLGDSVITE